MFPTICEKEGGLSVILRPLQASPEKMKTMPTVYRHYSRRLECLSFANVTAKVAYFLVSYFESVVPVWGLNPRCPARHYGILKHEVKV